MFSQLRSHRGPRGAEIGRKHIRNPTRNTSVESRPASSGSQQPCDSNPHTAHTHTKDSLCAPHRLLQRVDLKHPCLCPPVSPHSELDRAERRTSANFSTSTVGGKLLFPAAPVSFQSLSGSSGRLNLEPPSRPASPALGHRSPAGRASARASCPPPSAELVLGVLVASQEPGREVTREVGGRGCGSGARGQRLSATVATDLDAFTVGRLSSSVRRAHATGPPRRLGA